MPRKGYVVAPLTVDAIQNTYDVRRVLEAAAAAKAAKRARPEAVAKMREFAQSPVFEGTRESYWKLLEANMRFHLAVAAASENGFLVSVVRHCLTQHSRVQFLGPEFPILSGSGEEHHAIVDAIEHHDVDAARWAMEQHLDGANQLVLDFLVRGRIRGVGV